MLEMKSKKTCEHREELIEAVAGIPCESLAILCVFSNELHMLSCSVILSENLYWKIIDLLLVRMFLIYVADGFL
jgi:hypothetical protein